jgi:hypothetical protein
MNEALHETVHQLSWRGEGATRLVVLLADAPPHLDYGGPQYDEAMVAALGKGIKVFRRRRQRAGPQGEFIQRQIAQYTGGKFVFLTYQDARGPAAGRPRDGARRAELLGGHAGPAGRAAGDRRAGKAGRRGLRALGFAIISGSRRFSSVG